MVQLLVAYQKQHRHPLQVDGSVLLCSPLRENTDWPSCLKLGIIIRRFGLLVS